MDVALFTKKREKILMLQHDELTPNPLQPRRVFDGEELLTLSRSIKSLGMLQPVTVKRLEPLPHPMPQPTAKYEIVAGERRWRAALLAGLDKIPCIVVETDKTGSAMMALAENIMRSDLSFFEEAGAIRNLMLMTGLTQSELAKKLSMSQPALSNKLRLLKLSERERLMALENGFSERHVRALVRIENENERRPIMLEIINCQLSAAETEVLVENHLCCSAETGDAISNAKPKLAKRIRKGEIRDMRFFYNSVERSVSLLRDAGMTAEWKKTEQDDEIEIMIRVSRSRL